MTSWYPVDYDDDGTWELAIAQGAGQPIVGLFDPQISDWIAGPVQLPAVADNWGVDDFDANGTPEFAYLLGDTLRILNEVGVERTHWVAPFQPLHALFFGTDSHGNKLVGLYSPSDVYLFEVLTGISIGTVNRGLRYWRHVYEPAAGSATTLHIHGSYSYVEVIGGFCGEVDHHIIRSYSEDWISRTATTLGGIGYACGTPDSVKWSPVRLNRGRLSVGSAAILVWEMGERSSPYGTERLLGFWSESTSPIWSRFVSYEYPAPDRRREFAIGDLDADGVNECYMPIADSSKWEVRNLTDGALLSTISGMPDVDLQSGPLLTAGEPIVFYFSDSTLFYFDSDISSGVFDDPQGPGTDRTLLISATPNPFNAAVTLAWIQEASFSSLTIHNILGQTVRTFDEFDLSGKSTVTWDGLDGRGRPVASGVYFARLATRDQVATAKLVMLR